MNFVPFKAIFCAIKVAQGWHRSRFCATLFRTPKISKAFERAILGDFLIFWAKNGYFCATVPPVPPIYKLL